MIFLEKVLLHYVWFITGSSEETKNAAVMGWIEEKMLFCFVLF